MIPPPDDENPPAFAPNELDLLWMVGLAMTAMAHPLLFVVALLGWGVYIFHRVLPGSGLRRLSGRGWRRLPPPPAPPGAAATPAAGDQVLLTRLLTQTPPDGGRTAHGDAPRAPLRWREWSRLVLEAPHVVVVGSPGSGKSTLVRALLPMLARHGQIALIDPHRLKASWPWPAIGARRDYGAIIDALRALVQELTRRYQHPEADPRLTVVLDEVPAIVLHAGKDWGVLYPQLVCEGRKAHIHTLIMTQSGLVKPLGLEGKGDLRDGLVCLSLGEHAIAEDPTTATMARPAVLRCYGTVYPIDLTAIPVYARLPVDDTARWEPPAHTALSVPEPPVAPDAPTAPDVPEITPAEWDYIATLHACGYPPSSIAQMLPGYTSRQYRAYKDKVDYAVRQLKDAARRRTPNEGPPTNDG